jgi:fumarylacetoacetate (FAA) hydrolase
MKLATLRDGSRDGRLVVVSADLTQCSDARHIAPSLRAALEDWDAVAPALDLVARGVASGAQPVERFHERDAHSPLPHAGPDPFLDPRAALRTPHEAIDIAPEVAVFTGPVPAGATPEAALAAVRLLALRLGPAFAPVAVTPDELGSAWAAGRLAGVLMLSLNGSPLGRADAGGMASGFGALIAEAARAGGLPAGHIVGSGPLPGKRPDRAPRFGDTLRLEMQDAAGRSVFGAIEQAIARAVA